MKKNVYLVLFLFTVFGLVTFSSKNATAVESIKVGVLLPLSGALSTVGVQCRAGAEVAADEINAGGGIKSMNGAKIELIFGDSGSAPETGVAETERLINRERVSLIMGAYQSAVTFPASEVAQRYKCPWYVNIAVKDEITERGYNYVFRDCSKTSYDTQELVRAIDLFAKENDGKRPKTFGLLYEGTDWGRGVASYAKKDFSEAGINLVFDEAVPSSHNDFKPQLIKMKGTKPDMLVLALYTAPHLVLNKQMTEEKFYLPYGLWSLGGGSEDPTFYEALPVEAVEYMIVHDDIDVQAFDKPWIKAIDKKINDKIKVGLNNSSYGGYGPLYVIKDVLERAASADRDKIRDAFAATDITNEKCDNIKIAFGSESYCPALVRGVVRVKFDEQGQNTFSSGQITQNQKGKKIPLCPIEVRPKGAKVIWPIPTFDKR